MRGKTKPELDSVCQCFNSFCTAYQNSVMVCYDFTYLIDNNSNKNISYENAEEMMTFSVADLLGA